MDKIPLTSIMQTLFPLGKVMCEVMKIFGHVIGCFSFCMFIRAVSIRLTEREYSLFVEDLYPAIFFFFFFYIFDNSQTTNQDVNYVKMQLT